MSFRFLLLILLATVTRGVFAMPTAPHGQINRRYVPGDGWEAKVPRILSWICYGVATVSFVTALIPASRLPLSWLRMSLDLIFIGTPPNFAWAAGTSVQEQAQWLREARDLSVAGGKVRMMIVFNVDFTFFDPAGDPQAGYAMIRPDGSCPACDALK